MALFQGGDGAGQQARSQRRNGADGHSSQVAGFEGDQFFAHAAQFSENHARVINHGLAERGGPHAPRQTLEQLDAQQVLGLVQHFGRGRLGHADVIGGAAQ
ncbi:hypothetical protein D3C73_1397150 [compost metagenome]